MDKVVEEIMTVDPKHHKYFVARRGEVIRRIGDEFGGVVVSFPRQGVATDKVSFFGGKIQILNYFWRENSNFEKTRRSYWQNWR